MTKQPIIAEGKLLGYRLMDDNGVTVELLGLDMQAHWTRAIHHLLCMQECWNEEAYSHYGIDMSFDEFVYALSRTIHFKGEDRGERKITMTITVGAEDE